MAQGKNRVPEKEPPFYLKAFYFVSYLGFVGLERAIRALPRPVAYKIARGLAWFYFQLDFVRYATTMRNLCRAFSAEKEPWEIREICHKCFMHLADTAVDLIKSNEITDENRHKYFVYDTKIDVVAERKKMIETNKGVVAISAHLGSQEMLVGYVKEWGVGRENIVTKRIKNPYIDKYLQGQRRSLGVNVIPHRRSAKEIIRRMQSGEITVFLLDQRASYHEGIKVNFFGEPVVAHKAIAQLAMAFNLDVYPIFAIREPDGRYRIIVQDQLKLISTGDFEKDTRSNTQLFQDVIEKMVRKYPEQWLWPHNRWKRGENAP